MDERLKELATEARNEARLCRAQVFNCCYQDDGINKILSKHAMLFRKLAKALVGPDEEDKAWDDLARRIEEKFGGGKENGCGN